MAHPTRLSARLDFRLQLGGGPRGGLSAYRHSAWGTRWLAGSGAASLSSTCMRVARVLTNQTCNQNCNFCGARREVEDPEFAATRAVADRMVEALESGATELVLSGGEPTLRQDLSGLVAYARRRGAKRVVLETNAAQIDTSLARVLAREGLDVARVKLPAWGEQCDVITEDPGGCENTIAAIRTLLHYGVEVHVLVPIVRGNTKRVGELPERLVAAGFSSTQILVRWFVESPDEHALAPLSEATTAIEALADAGRKVGLPVRLDGDSFVPPCAFPNAIRLAQLYTLTPGGANRAGYERIEQCNECRVRDRCPGVPKALLDSNPDYAYRPVKEERVRRRLSIIESVESQITRELVTTETCRRSDGSAVPMHTVRVNFHCNQSCHFCFVSTHLPPAREQDIRSAIEAAGRQRAILALSGGEPTLNANLSEYVRLAKSAGVREVELQTNATRLADSKLVAELEAAGVDVAFVSLHGATAPVSDDLTGAPGTYEQTVLGLDELQRSSIRLRLNFVFCQKNYTEFPALIRMVAERWPKALQSVSFVAPSTDLVPRDAWLIPRYADVMPLIQEGAALADQLGVELTGFESMCGLPLCLIPGSLAPYFDLVEVAEGADGGEFIKPDACRRCKLEPNCWGIRTRYAELYGTDELRPVTDEPDTRALGHQERT